MSVKFEKIRTWRAVDPAVGGGWRLTAGVDYICPQCQEPISSVNSGRRACPQCGLHLNEKPTMLLSRNQDERLRYYHEFWNDNFPKNKKTESLNPKNDQEKSNYIKLYRELAKKFEISDSPKALFYSKFAKMRVE